MGSILFENLKIGFDYFFKSQISRNIYLPLAPILEGDHPK